MGKIDSKALASGLEDSDPFNTTQNWQPILGTAARRSIPFLVIHTLEAGTSTR